jgi:hypothetical protein
VARQVGVEHASGEPVDILGVGLAEALHPLTGPAAPSPAPHRRHIDASRYSLIITHVNGALDASRQ